MISNIEIKKIATKFQTSEFNIAQEYCQHIFLMNLYKNKLSDNLFFKGGTSLRIVFGSPRFSEDLDFSSTLSTKILETLLIKTLKDLQNFAIKTELIEAKTTSSGGYLAIFICEFLNYSVQLQIEVSQRAKKKISGEIFTINSEFIPVYTLYNLETKKLIDEKIQATLTRQKPRDFFDIYFLLRLKILEPTQKKELDKIKKLIEQTKINFANELKQFLPLSFHGVIKDFKKTLISEINRNSIF
jgi:hypothetical protein